jgi:plasmid rolling circle replication initiator protein Rep
VHIQKTYSKKNSSPEQEASKYTVKDSDYLIQNNLKLSAKVVDVLDSALRSVRLIAYGGILKKIYNSLKLDEIKLTDDEQLENMTEYLAYVIKKYSWNFGFKFYKQILD